ncbi:MAG: hypoxanthine phosphoribosyltransferase [Nitrospirae bacterium]|nr:hypoxanthine phosphoribosyltransferase [Nitrospirota bacterium]MBI3351195.1 hypoxanthine phosphoribosyltransferase [Nitrospirota bacterium]
MAEKIFGKPLITQEAVQKRIKELGQKITRDYAGKDLYLIGVLKGAFAFYADIARAISLPLRVGFISVSSYQGATHTSGKVKIVSDLKEEIVGKDVLLVEDIVDSGLTLQFLKKKFNAKKPNSLKVCSLLNKAAGRQVDVDIDYVGFEIPDKYIVGYGLDYDNKYRNLPYMAVLENIEE